MLPRPCTFNRRDVTSVLAGGALLAGAFDAGAQLKNGDDPESSARWQMLRKTLLAGRPVAEAAPDQLVLIAPARATDPAFVPMSVRAATASDRVERLTLVIDDNPSPIAAVVDFPADGALPQFETRVRVDEYSFVRAIATTQSGRLMATQRFVKASGGCSAAAGSDEAAALASLGKMRFQTDAPPVEGQPVQLIWRLSHPNHSGMAMNQLTRQITPAHFMRHVRIWQGDRLLISGDFDFALSENPMLRIAFIPKGSADLRAEADDSHGRQFEGRAALSQLFG